MALDLITKPHENRSGDDWLANSLSKHARYELAIKKHKQTSVVIERSVFRNISVKDDVMVNCCALPSHVCLVSTPTGCTTEVGGACYIPHHHGTSDAGSDNSNCSTLASCHGCTLEHICNYQAGSLTVSFIYFTPVF